MGFLAACPSGWPGVIRILMVRLPPHQKEENVPDCLYNFNHIQGSSYTLRALLKEHWEAGVIFL